MHIYLLLLYPFDELTLLLLCSFFFLFTIFDLNFILSYINIDASTFFWFPVEVSLAHLEPELFCVLFCFVFWRLIENLELQELAYSVRTSWN